MDDGLYKVAFSTPRGEGSGVVVLTAGTLLGGDSMMGYSGTYAETGGDFRAGVDVNKHSDMIGMESVFGVDRVHINLIGKSNGNSATVQGSSPQAPGLAFNATLTKLV